jgi:hypothetical protein
MSYIMNNNIDLTNQIDQSEKKNKILTRPTFLFNNDNTKPIKAGGVLIYKKHNKQIKVLMIKTSYKNIDRYEDIGGKTDYIDTSELDTVSREVNEETNLIINEQLIKQQLQDINNKCLYIPHGKYILYFIHANSYESGLTKECFGDRELHDNIPRTIEWINIESLINNKLNIHPRLCANEFKDALKDIQRSIDNQQVAIL